MNRHLIDNAQNAKDQSHQQNQQRKQDLLEVHGLEAAALLLLQNVNLYPAEDLVAPLVSKHGNK
jgi:hypothetical protein